MGSHDPKPSSQEQRARIRFVTRLEARVFPGFLACHIADVSNRGARLQFKDRAEVPDALILVEWNGGRGYECRVAWRRGLEIGVEFLSTCALQGAAPPVFALAQDAWQSAPDRAVTTFTVRKHDRRWVVTLSGPTLGDPAVVANFVTRWEAQRFARVQAERFEGRACAAGA